MLMTYLPDVHYNHRYSWASDHPIGRRKMLGVSSLGAIGLVSSISAASAFAQTAPASGQAVKLTLLLRRNPAHIENVWLAALERLAQDTAKLAPTVPGLLARRVNRALGYQSPIANAAASAFDAADEFVFDTLADLERFTASAQFAELTMPRDLLLDGQSEAAVGRWVVLHQQAAPAARPIKIMTLPKRAAHMTQAQFAQYWVHTHGQLALAHAPTRNERLWRTEFSPNLDAVAIAGYAGPSFDGVGCIWFRDEEALKAEFSDSYYTRVMAPDEPKFTNPAASSVIPSLELTAWRRT